MGTREPELVSGLVARGSVFGGSVGAGVVGGSVGAIKIMSMI